MTEAFRESTKPLMRPHQVVEAKEDARNLESIFQAPDFIRNQVQDLGETRRQLESIKKALHDQEPRPYSEGERDAALARHDQLLSEIVNGMPTQAEMRRNPAGAVDKHRSWEKRNKEKILEVKNLRLRMHASGMLDDLPDATDVANIERFRPSGASHELNMHNEQIPGKIQFGPAPGAGPASVITDEEKATLKEIDPELADMLALLNNDQRQQIKAILQQPMTPTEVNVSYKEATDLQPKRKGREWTDEDRAEASRRAKERARAKRAKAE